MKTGIFFNTMLLRNIAVTGCFSFLIGSLPAQEPVQKIFEYQHSNVRTEEALQFTRTVLNRRSSRIELFYGLSIAISNFPSQLAAEVDSIYRTTKDKELFAMSAHYLFRNKTLNITDYLTHLENRMSINKKHSLFNCFSMVGQEQRYDSMTAQYSIEDFFIPEQATIIVALAKETKKEGKIFLIDSKKTITDTGLSVLAHSFSDMPYCFSEGNTPMGLYYFNTIETSTNPSIGPTRAIKSRMPFEISASKFSEQKFKVWNAENYVSLFPDRIQSEIRWTSVFFESYRAGAKGRHLIYLHGSGLTASLFTDQPFYPHTPTRGCLTTIETEEQNDQARLVSILEKAGIQSGYMLVIPLELISTAAGNITTE